MVDTGTGEDVVLVKVGETIEGRTETTNQLSFVISVNADGEVSLDQQRSIVHPDPTDPNESITLADDSLITLSVTATDGDGDSHTVADPINIAQNFLFFDDAPAITTVTDPLNIANTGPTPSGSGSFVYSVGADTNGDFDDISVAGFTVSVNGVPIVLPPGALVEGVEDASAANYTFSFDYDTGAGGTETATGTLVFHKTGPEAGTYEVTLTSGPVSGFTVLGTGSESTSFEEYDLNGGAPEVIVAALDTDLFAQFTAFSRGSSPPPNLQTDDNNPATPPAPNNAWLEGEVFTSAVANPQASNSDAGVNGNTMDSGEVLDFDLFHGSRINSDLTAVPDLGRDDVHAIVPVCRR